MMADSQFAWVTNFASPRDVGIFLIFKMAAVSYLGFLKLIFLTAVHHNAKFCGDRSYRYKDIAIFHIFLMKCKNSRAYRS